MGMRSTWDPNWKGRDFAVDTKIEQIGLTGSCRSRSTTTSPWAPG